MSTPEGWADLQAEFLDRVRSQDDLDRGTVVVLPSLSFPEAELRKITGIQFYEERLLCLLLLLRNPALRLAYVTSLPVDPAIVDYHLALLPDGEDARERLCLVSADDGGARPLSAKLLDQPSVLDEIRRFVAGSDVTGSDVTGSDVAGSGGGWILPFNVTPLEVGVADRLGLPLLGPTPEQGWLGSKTGSRRAAIRAGVAVLPGSEDLWTEAALEAEARRLTDPPIGAAGVVLKLNNSFSGQGNVIVGRDGVRNPLGQSTADFCASDESWPTYLAKVAEEGAIVETLMPAGNVVSPSVQLRIPPWGEVEVVSTHDQVLGGPHHQVYLGCRFPARAEYRQAIQDAAIQVARVLAGDGVVGTFGIDFLVVPEGAAHRVYLSEINLRMGGTTHPFQMARLATEAAYDQVAGELVSALGPRSYVGTDNIKSAGLVGPPTRVIEALRRRGLLFDPARRTGTTLHLLGALPSFGKMGVTCIGESADHADELYAEVQRALGVA